MSGEKKKYGIIEEGFWREIVEDLVTIKSNLFIYKAFNEELRSNTPKGECKVANWPAYNQIVGAYRQTILDLDSLIVDVLGYRDSLFADCKILALVDEINKRNPYGDGHFKDRVHEWDRLNFDKSETEAEINRYKSEWVNIFNTKEDVIETDLVAMRCTKYYKIRTPEFKKERDRIAHRCTSRNRSKKSKGIPIDVLEKTFLAMEEFLNQLKLALRLPTMLYDCNPFEDSAKTVAQYLFDLVVIGDPGTIMQEFSKCDKKIVDKYEKIPLHRETIDSRYTEAREQFYEDLKNTPEMRKKYFGD